ncbi:uncharacterized protein FTOL_07220 [Fusarium torulosum]|uniref:LysM domain-containing protein n=1 Tax=Fusarium torulosum TaxID=33205 RepID=A0AAE8MAF6_9HYPO|nr:uncharacterized protein FTOL_07220 [Fusarium torulosum]
MARFLHLLAFVGLLQVGAGAAIAPRSSETKYPYDEKTSADCTWWFDMDAAISCSTLLENEAITIVQFRRWFESVPEPQPGNPPKPSSTKPTQPSPTKTSNGVKTSQPTQPDIVGNCKTFYLVQKGENCASIAAKNREWNGNDDCSSLWADAWACVMTLDYKPGDQPAPSPTKPSNGITTQQPTQPHIVDNCNKFHFVESGESCAAIASKYSITGAQFLKWNPSVEAGYTGLWANAYACVSVIGHTPSPSTKATTTKDTTTKAAASSTIPVQAGNDKNCNKFHQVKSTTTCTSIDKYYSLPFATFFKWNPSVGKNCESLLVGYNVCVGITGWKPTPTTGNNSIVTPSPIQTGMISSCNKFHPIATKTTCASLKSYYNLDMADFFKWNPAVGTACTNLWVGYNVCVGVIGQKPKPGPTSKPIGVPTPDLVQSVIVKGCKKFHEVKATTTCASIQKYYSITMAQLYKWNPAIESGCTN